MDIDNFDFPKAIEMPLEKLEPEAILKHRVKGGKKQYSIRWKGYTDHEASWVNETEISHKVPEMLEAYHKANVEKKDWIPPPVHLTEYITNRIELQRKKPRRCVSCFKKDGLLYYRVEFHRDVYYSVEANLLRDVSPDIICSFLENKIKVSK